MGLINMIINNPDQIDNEKENQLYESYEIALKNCSNSGYEEKELVEVVIEKTKIFKKELTNINSFDIGVLRILTAILLAKKDKAINVIDFGGAAGHHYFIAKKILGEEIKINWRVVETTKMANSCSNIFSDENLSFFDDISKAKNNLNNIDLVFTSSAIQYCPNPIFTFNQLLEIDSKFLFMTRTPFTSLDRELITIQKSLLSHNGPGSLPNSFEDKLIYYPVTYIPQKKVEEAIKKNFNIEFILEEDKAKLFFQNLPINNYYGYFCKNKK
jgi:putative methyltransferase (TIGR04325 family)